MPARKDITLHQAMLARSSCNKLHKLVTINERFQQRAQHTAHITMTVKKAAKTLYVKLKQDAMTEQVKDFLVNFINRLRNLGFLLCT